MAETRGLTHSLGINTIRVYNLNPYLNHDECASIFNAAGIYLALDVRNSQVFLVGSIMLTVA